jgi:hypothetical protein
MNSLNMKNPFGAANDWDRHYIWERLIRADSDAFVEGDWGKIAGDFDAENFEGIRCGLSSDPDKWQLVFADLDLYRDRWLEASRAFLARPFEKFSHREAVYARTRLLEIDINGTRALAHKKFSGEVKYADGEVLSGERQTIYRLHKKGGVWKVVGFLGFLPLTE